MKIVIGLLLGIIAALGGWIVLDGIGGAPRTAISRSALPVETDAGRIEALEHEVHDQAAAIRRLEFELSSLGQDGRRSALASDPEVRVPRADDSTDPRRYLDQYVHSFDQGGAGSELFRLQVEAYALELLEDICAIVRDPRAIDPLRKALASMLGDGRFRHNARALDALLDCVRNSEHDDLALSALGSYGKIGNEGAGLALERCVWTLRAGPMRATSIALIARLAGPDANQALVRLFRGAPTEADRLLVLAQISTADADGALELLRLASADEVNVRLNAAQRLVRFRGEAFLAFVNEWIAVERDENVRRVLGAALEAMQQIAPYSAQKVVGPPDADANRDHPNAWASKSQDMGEQWLLLGYTPSLRANAVRIHEVNVAGAVAEVVLIAENGTEHSVWKGVDPTRTPGVFEVSFGTTSYRVRGVRVVLDTNRAPDWNEIDAVELVGPDGRAWASSATASSSYGQ